MELNISKGNISNISKVNRDVLIEIALLLDLKDVYNLCRSSKRFANLCNSEVFWRKKIYNDFQINYQEKDTKEAYKRFTMIKENKEHCHKLVKKRIVNPDAFILDIVEDQYFKNYSDFLVYRFLTAKLLGKGAAIPLYYEKLYDRYRINEIYDKIERSGQFRVDDFYIFMGLLEQVKKNSFQFVKAYINAMIRGDIPFDVTWNQLCNYDFY